MCSSRVVVEKVHAVFPCTMFAAPSLRIPQMPRGMIDHTFPVRIEKTIRDHLSLLKYSTPFEDTIVHVVDIPMTVERGGFVLLLNTRLMITGVVVVPLHSL